MFPTPSLVVCVGSPASGKSTFCAQFPPDDVIHFDRTEGTGEQRKALMRRMAACRLAQGRRVAIDATNLSPTDRAAWCGIAESAGAPAIAVLLDAPWEALTARDSQRAEPHDLAILRRCYEKYRIARTSVLDEAFQRIVIEKQRP